MVEILGLSQSLRIRALTFQFLFLPAAYSFKVTQFIHSYKIIFIYVRTVFCDLFASAFYSETNFFFFLASYSVIRRLPYVKMTLGPTNCDW